MAHNSSKDRGIFLTVLFIYGALEAILLFFSGLIYPITGAGFRGEVLYRTLIVSILELVPLVVALYGIWKWKRWGVYSLFASVAISVLSTVIFDIVIAYGGYAPGVITFDVLGGAIWFWGISRKWSHFK